MDKDSEKKKKGIWAKYEKEKGHSLTRLSEAVDSLMLPSAHDDETDLQDLDDNIPAYIEISEAYAADLGYVPATTMAKGAPKKIRLKWLERRFYLVDFVVSHSKTRVKWEQVTKEWNKANPSDIMSLAVLKGEFYRAMRESPLRLQWMVTTTRKMAERHRQVYQDYNYWYTEKVWEEDYLGLLRWQTWIINFYEYVRPPGKFLQKSICRLIDTTQSIEEIRERQFDKQGGAP